MTTFTFGPANYRPTNPDLDARRRDALLLRAAASRRSGEQATGAAEDALRREYGLTQEQIDTAVDQLLAMVAAIAAPAAVLTTPGGARE